MQVRIWGRRGSITTPGRETLRYGGESTCLEIRSGGRRIIIDAGSGLRRLGQAMLKEGPGEPAVLLLTHAHWDHLAGFPFFRPAYRSGYRFHVCGGPEPQRQVLRYLRHQMEPPYFPVSFDVLKAGFSEGCRCDAGVCRHRLPGAEDGPECYAIPLNHPDGGFGFRFVEDGRSFVFLSDNEIRFAHPGGLDRAGYLDACRGADLLIHDAQYTEAEYGWAKSWGHATYGDAVELALEAGVRRLGLFHHDPDRSDDELDRQVAWCQERIAAAGGRVECFACADGMELTV